MTTTTVTNIGYTGTIQNANVYGEYGIPVNAYLWGAGGGSATQAPGNAGGYSKVYFVAKPGDILTVAVGQGGGRGGELINPWTPSGFSGASYSGLLFNTRFPPPGQAVYPYGQRYRNTTSTTTSFLSQWGVWNSTQVANDSFMRQYSVNFPTTDNVIFQMVASTYGRVYLDGELILEGAGRSPSGAYNDTINQAFRRVTGGNHIIRIEADGSAVTPNPNGDNPNAIGVIFGTGDLTTYAGGRGGESDNENDFQGGSAGGGGGATVLSLNGVVIGIAAGGAGGATRPAVNTSTDFRYNNGQDGQDVAGFANLGYAQVGAGGGGGGGLWAGQGGTAGYGAPTIAGTAGTNGTSLGDTTAQTVGRLPYTNSFYPGNNVATGGLGQGTAQSGGNGFIALEYQTGGGGAVNDLGTWKPVQTTYINVNGTWRTVQTTYINVNGTWKPIQGAPVPTFAPFYGAFAPASRSFGSRLTPPPPPPAPTYDYSSYTGYGSSDMF
jgi:hypothetical protein